MRTVLTIETRGRGLHDITHAVEDAVRACHVTDGLCVVYVAHTSASLVVQENADPSASRDLEAFFDRLVPDGDPMFRHQAEGPDDMPAHIRSALTHTSEVFPVAGGTLLRGAWQGLFLFEHRKAAHRRTVHVMVIRAG